MSKTKLLDHNSWLMTALIEMHLPRVKDGPDCSAMEKG